MSILLVGLNHRTAPVSLRERLALSSDELRQHVLRDLSATLQVLPGHIDQPVLLGECIIVSTCNRLEIYATAWDSAQGWAAIERFVADLRHVPLDDLLPHLYRLEGQAAIEHLMNVAAGLESMILGETQILSQVAQAYTLALGAETTGPVLPHLFRSAVHAGKRARTETAISRHSTSVGHAGALLIKSHVGDLAQVPVLVVGAGSTAGLAATALHLQGAQTLACINRTLSKAEALAAQVMGRALEWSQLVDALRWADVVITATSAPQAIICVADLPAILAQRDGRPLLLIDLCVPRNIEKAVNLFADVQYYDIDDLQSVLDANLAQRQAAIPLVEAIINQEIERFQEWLHGRQVVSVIADVRRKANAVAKTEVEHALRQLDGLDQRSRHVIDCLAHRIVNKLLHEPTMRLKAQAASGNDHIYARTVRELFALEVADESGSPA